MLSSGQIKLRKQSSKCKISTTSIINNQATYLPMNVIVGMEDIVSLLLLLPCLHGQILTNDK